MMTLCRWRKLAQCYPCAWAALYILWAVAANSAQHEVMALASPAHGAQVGSWLDVLTLARVAVQVWITPFYTVTRLSGALLAFLG